MTSRTTTLARRERETLCDLALELGPDAPTLCDGWDAAHLMAHLFVREQRPLGAVGILVAPLEDLADHAMARALGQGYPDLVARVRRPRFTPFIGPLDGLVNTLEYLVHHEDLRRAAPGWTARTLSPSDLDAAWTAVGRAGRMLVRGAGVPVVIERADTGARTTLRKGSDPVVVTGDVVEVVMWAFGRDELRDVRFSGPEDRIERLRSTPRGL